MVESRHGGLAFPDHHLAALRQVNKAADTMIAGGMT
jgi:hypothetical protein